MQSSQGMIATQDEDREDWIYTQTFVTKLTCDPERAVQAGRSLQQLAGMADFAIVRGKFLVFTMRERKTVANMKSNKKFQLALGRVEWTRALTNVLCKALGFTTHPLKLDEATVYPYPFQSSGFFWVRSKRMPLKEKLEHLNELIDLPKTIEALPRFAEQFEKIFGDDKEYTCPKALKQACCTLFGKWAPDCRTVHQKGGQIECMIQIPPKQLEQLTGKMGGEGYLCHECGGGLPTPKYPNRLNVESHYCSRKHKAVNEQVITCPCGSTDMKLICDDVNGKPQKVPITYFNQIEAPRGSSLRCAQCNKMLWHKPHEVGMWIDRFVGPIGKRARDDHVPEWATHKNSHPPAPEPEPEFPPGYFPYKRPRLE